MNSIALTPRDRLTEVAEWLEARTPLKAGIAGFDMTSWVGHNECGTTCCIAGAIVQFDQAAKGGKPLTEGYVSELGAELNAVYSSIGEYAGALCGLNSVEAAMLFTENMKATSAEAAETIRRYLDTGELYWNGDEGESEEIIRSRALPAKNSVLLGADGKPLADGDTNVVAVLNTATGVVRAWKPFGNKRFQHKAALNACAALSQLPGHSAWELAPKDDLKAILDSSDEEVFDLEQYPDILDEWYWAQETHPSSPSDYAWLVNFVTGSISRDCRFNGLRAMAVCRPLPASQK